MDARKGYLKKNCLQLQHNTTGGGDINVVCDGPVVPDMLWHIIGVSYAIHIGRFQVNGWFGLFVKIHYIELVMALLLLDGAVRTLPIHAGAAKAFTRLR